MRGQASMEAITLFASATILLSIFMIFYGAEIGTRAEQREYQSLQDVGGLIQQEIQIARQSGPGYERAVELPSGSPSKRLIIEVNYSANESRSSEVILRFDPPLDDGIEASVLLGPRVWGSLSGGNNVIRTSDGGIILIPEEEPLYHQGASIAYAHLAYDSVQLKDDITCQYEIANKFESGDTLVVWFNATDGIQDVCRKQLVAYDPDVRSTTIGPDDWPDDLDMLAEDRNLTCGAIFASAVPGGGGNTGWQDCGPSFSGITKDEEADVSDPVPIVNSPPSVTVSNEKADRDGEGWRISLRVDVEDADGDARFNVTLLRDGTNAHFIDCSDGACVANGISSSTTFTVDYVPVYPVTDGGTSACGEVNEVTFKIQAIEADNDEGLYTLEPVSFHNLQC